MNRLIYRIEAVHRYISRNKFDFVLRNNILMCHHSDTNQHYYKLKIMPQDGFERNHPGIYLALELVLK